MPRPIIGKKTKRTTLTLNAKTMDKIKDYAEDEGRSVSNYVSNVLDKHVEDRESK